MNTSTKRLLFWTPRIICIVFAVFISLFALDVFAEGQGILKTIAALLIHLIPTAVILLVLFISWRREWIGAIVFIALAVFYIVMAWGRFPLTTYLMISGPLFLMGLLFLLNWVYRAQLKTR